jgi:hypothetical protein
MKKGINHALQQMRCRSLDVVWIQHIGKGDFASLYTRFPRKRGIAVYSTKHDWTSCVCTNEKRGLFEGVDSDDMLEAYACYILARWVRSIGEKLTESELE